MIFGGAGQLGQSVVRAFKSAGWTTVAVDFAANPDATHAVVIAGDARNDSGLVLRALSERHLTPHAVVSVAGGFAAGSATSDTLFDDIDKMHRFNVVSAAEAAHVAAKTLARA